MPQRSERLRLIGASRQVRSDVKEMIEFKARRDAETKTIKRIC